MLALALFTLGNAICALAPNLGALLAGRVVMGVGAISMSLMSAMALALVEPRLAGRALSWVFLGVSVSYVVGLPLGTWLGYGFGWRSPFWAATAACALALLALWGAVPPRLRSPAASFAGLAALLRDRALLAALLVTQLYFTAIFVVFSYVGPVLQALVPMSPARLALTMVLFGVSGMAGTLLGGRANDRFGAGPSVAVALIVLASTMLLLPFTAGHWPAMMVVMLVWGTAGFSMMAPQQSRLSQLAPAQVALALSLNASMLYLGTAAGAAVGGAASAWVGFARLPWVGAPFALAAALLLHFGPREPARAVKPA